MTEKSSKSSISKSLRPARKQPASVLPRASPTP